MAQTIILSNIFNKLANTGHYKRITSTLCKQVFKMATVQDIARLQQRAELAEKIIDQLTKQIGQLQESFIHSKKDDFRTENEQLRGEVDSLKKQLVNREISNGTKQYYDFLKATVEATASIGSPKDNVKENDKSPSSSTPAAVEIKQSSPQPQNTPPTEDQPEKKGKSEKKEKKKGENVTKKSSEPDIPIDVARLDFRVGRIVTAKKHPDADSLYVEEVDVGEGKLRTVVSGLVKFIPEEEMQNRMVILLCNLKPAKMRGITSEAMVMCASTPDKVEILTPPEGCEPGDVVEFDGYTRTPDAMLNPKKKVFEACAPDLKTDDCKVATYKGVPFIVPGKGKVVAPSLCSVQIK